MFYYVRKETALGNKEGPSPKDHREMGDWLYTFSWDQGQLHIL